MGTALLEQEPERSAEVLGHLQRVFPKPDQLMAVIPPRLQCNQALYELFFRQGHYDHCAQLIDTMDRVNRQRFTRKEMRDISVYELTRTPPPSREETLADLARRRLALAGARGDAERYADLRRAEGEARRALCQPLLAQAAKAAAAGDYFRARREAKSSPPEGQPQGEADRGRLGGGGGRKAAAA